MKTIVLHCPKFYFKKTSLTNFTCKCLKLRIASDYTKKLWRIRFPQPLFLEGEGIILPIQFCTTISPPPSLPWWIWHGNHLYLCITAPVRRVTYSVLEFAFDFFFKLQIHFAFVSVCKFRL